MHSSTLIVTHTNTDFDAFAAMVAAQKLYPDAALFLGGAVNRNVREFQALYADLLPVVDLVTLDRDAVRKLVIVDTIHANRLGEIGELCLRDDVEVVAFDHHAQRGELPPYLHAGNLVLSNDGSLVTLLLRIISQREISVTPFEATVFALGIHEDTGSLLFNTTTPADAEALALCMRLGAETAVLERWLTSALTPAQRSTLAFALHAARELPIAGATVLVSSLREELYVEGVSIVAHRVMDLTGCDGFFLLVEMEGKVFVTARSRGRRLDVAQVLAAVGGGGHTAAASAVVRDLELEEVAALVAAAVPAALAPVRTVAELLAPGAAVVGATASIDDTVVRCYRGGLAGVVVTDGEFLVGKAALVDLERAAGHGLGHAPLKAVMSSRVTVLPLNTPLERAAIILAGEEIGWAPVVRERGEGPVRRTEVLGSVSRRAVVGEEPEPEVSHDVVNLAGQLAELREADLLRRIQVAAGGLRGVYLVGGAVRDIILGEPGIDIDIAVEGDGIAFAKELAKRLGGRVRSHRKFGTAVVMLRGDDGRKLRIDVISTRSEVYEHPAALPSVEHAGIRSDLARRDFSINALAVSLKPETYGDLLDCFGGVEDLEQRRIVVLHSLSFIEDPTRILRALRYESRYGLRMDEYTLNLARSCCAMGLVGDLSSARLRDELLSLLDEPTVGFALRRIEELGFASAIHARLRVGELTRDLVEAGDLALTAHGLEEEVPRWRLRLIWMLRDLGPEEIANWCRRLRIRRRDAEVLERAFVLGSGLLRLTERGPTEAELHDLIRQGPLEAVLVALVLDRTGMVVERLGHYLAVTRHIRLAVTGEDLLALGFAPSAHLGEVLHSILRLKLNGVVQTREEELAAAERMRP